MNPQKQTERISTQMFTSLKSPHVLCLTLFLACKEVMSIFAECLHLNSGC